MKQFLSIRFAFFLSFFTILLFSCTKEGDAPPPVWSNVGTGTGASGSMTCKVDGSQWTAAVNMAAASLLDDVSNVSGTNSSSSSIAITIGEAIVLNGSYDLGLNSGNGAAYTSSSNGSSAWISHGGGSAGGMLIITAIDTENKLISGNFEFVAIRFTDNSYRYITQGQFTNLPYTNSASGPSDNSFTVDIDGEPFVPAAINGLILASMIRIVASDAQGIQSVSVSMPEDIEPGTYDIGSVFSDYSGMYNPDASLSTVSTSGTLIITTHDTGSEFIEGSFNFNSTEYAGTASFELTNGTFSINY